MSSPALRSPPTCCRPAWATPRWPTCRPRRDFTRASSGGLVFWLFCSSRHTAITVTSAISLLVGASLGEIAGGDTARFSALAAATALLVALIAFIAWLVKAGSIVNFISESVMVGFKCGVALFLASTQLPKLFGFHGEHGNFWVNSRYFLQAPARNQSHRAHYWRHRAGGARAREDLPQEQTRGVVRGGGRHCGFGLAGPRGARSEAAGRSAAGTAATRAARALDWGNLNAVLQDFNNLLPLAFACFLLAAVETAAIGRTFAAKHGGRLDANQEFLALAASNLAAGLGRGFPVSGGMSQSLVNEGGGRAHAAVGRALRRGLFWWWCCSFRTCCATLPQPVLAAVVLVAVAGLFKVSALKELWRGDRPEFVVAMAAIVGVLGQGLLRGVMIGAIISLVLLIRRASRPHVALLGRIPGTRRFSDHERHPANELIPGVLIFRPESGLTLFQHGSRARHDFGSGAR